MPTLQTKSPRLEQHQDRVPRFLYVVCGRARSEPGSMGLYIPLPKRKAVPVQRVPNPADRFPDLAWLEVPQTCPFFPWSSLPPAARGRALGGDLPCLLTPEPGKGTPVPSQDGLRSGHLPEDEREVGLRHTAWGLLPALLGDLGQLP